MTDAKPFFRPTPHRVVARALRPALAWAYVAAVAAAVVLGLVALVALIVSAAVWVFNRDLSIGGSVRDVSTVTLWVVGPLAVGAAVGGAAYASTESRSFPRTVAGTVVGLVIGAALAAIGAMSFVAAGLATGWAIAMPADGMGRVAARGLPAVAAGVTVSVWTWGRIADVSPWPMVAIFVLSPLVGALFVWMGDGAWAAVAARQQRRSDRNQEPKQTVSS